jgi:hypothetical protein
LFCQPHTIPSVILKVLCCPGRHGFAPSKFHSSDSIMRFIALSSIVGSGDLCKCDQCAPREQAGRLAFPELWPWRSSDGTYHAPRGALAPGSGPRGLHRVLRRVEYRPHL